MKKGSWPSLGGTFSWFFIFSFFMKRSRGFLTDKCRYWTAFKKTGTFWTFTGIPGRTVKNRDMSRKAGTNGHPIEKPLQFVRIFGLFLFWVCSYFGFGLSFCSPWLKFWIEVHSEPIKFIPINFEIYIRANPNASDSIRKKLSIIVQSQNLRILNNRKI